MLDNFVKSRILIYHNAKIKYLPNGNCKVTCFSMPVYKEQGWVCTKVEKCQAEKKYQAEKRQREPTDEVRKDSVKRAKDKIFEIAVANTWDYMVTFTLDPEKCNRYDPQEVKKKFCKWLENMVQRRGLKALIVPELHQDGAIHFHGLVNDCFDFVHSGTYKIDGRKQPVELSTLKRWKLTPDSEGVRDVFNIDEYKLGFATAIKLEGRIDTVAAYMTKYCTKGIDLHKILGKFYLAVGDIKRELPSELLDLDVLALKDVAKLVELSEINGFVLYACMTREELKKYEK